MPSGIKMLANSPNHKPHLGPHSDHTEALIAPSNSVLQAAGHYSGDDPFSLSLLPHLKYSLRTSRTLPFAFIAIRCGEVCRSEEDCFHAMNLQDGVDLFDG